MLSDFNNEVINVHSISNITLTSSTAGVSDWEAQTWLKMNEYNLLFANVIIYVILT